VSAPASTGGRLLYVSDLYNSVVDVYSVPSLKFVRKLSGFFEPQGECTNAAGDVWIADTGYEEIVEFAPGSTKPIATLPDALGYPASCAVNPIDGDLAVTNATGFSGNGSVLIFRNATGTPESFGNDLQVECLFAAYDDKGNLYVTGETAKAKYVLTELRAHAGSLETLDVTGGTIYYPGVALWSDGKLLLGDQECRNGTTSCLYVSTVSGKAANISSAIAFGDACDVVQVTLFDGALYGGNDDKCTHSKGSVDRWSYPKGQREAAVSGVHDPIGAAISGPATERP
jgi:DNA-binding beta-propeller fold protein YncE